MNDASLQQKRLSHFSLLFMSAMESFADPDQAFKTIWHLYNYWLKLSKTEKAILRYLFNNRLDLYHCRRYEIIAAQVVCHRETIGKAMRKFHKDHIIFMIQIENEHSPNHWWLHPSLFFGEAADFFQEMTVPGLKNAQKRGIPKPAPDQSVKKTAVQNKIRENYNYISTPQVILTTLKDVPLKKEPCVEPKKYTEIERLLITVLFFAKDELHLSTNPILTDVEKDILLRPAAFEIAQYLPSLTLRQAFSLNCQSDFVLKAAYDRHQKQLKSGKFKDARDPVLCILGTINKIARNHGHAFNYKLYFQLSQVFNLTKTNESDSIGHSNNLALKESDAKQFVH
ncbi:MAG: hypothetical protein WBF33_10330 [Candidatus Nitrosopolaris sp.]